jgi:hypothetical protein
VLTMNIMQGGGSTKNAMNSSGRSDGLEDLYMMPSMGSETQGLAFAPLKDTQVAKMFVTSPTDVFRRTLTGFEAGTSTTPAPIIVYQALDSNLSNPAREPERGWRSTLHWAAADPRTWYIGSTDQSYCSDLRWGRYALLSHVKAAVNIGNSTGYGFGGTYGGFNWDVFNQYETPATGFFSSSALAPVHTWRENQLLGLRFSLGYYGMADYLPSNAVLGTHGGIVFSDCNNRQCLDVDEMVFWGWNYYHEFDDHNSGLPSALGLFYTGAWSSRHNNFVSPMPRSNFAFWEDPTGAWTDSAIAWQNRSVQMVRAITANNTGADNWSLDWGRKNLAMHEILRPIQVGRPAGWPELYVGTTHLFGNGAFYNRFRVRLNDPIDGRLIEMSFGLTGTTLRGARQQRRYDPGSGATTGWARWVKPGDAANDKTLDDY